MWSLFCYFLFLISSSFGSSVGLCFVIETLTGYVHLHFYIWHLPSLNDRLTLSVLLTKTGTNANSVEKPSRQEPNCFLLCLLV